MFPLPPLDGGRIAVGLLPNFLALPLARLEHYGMAILLIGLLTIALDRVANGRRSQFRVKPYLRLHPSSHNPHLEIDRQFVVSGKPP